MWLLSTGVINFLITFHVERVQQKEKCVMIRVEASHEDSKIELRNTFEVLKLKHFIPLKKNLQITEKGNMEVGLMSKDNFHLVWLFNNYYIPLGNSPRMAMQYDINSDQTREKKGERRHIL